MLHLKKYTPFLTETDVKKFYKMLWKFKKENLFTIEEEEIVTMDDLDPSVQSLVIFDNCGIEEEQKPIEVEKNNASIIFLSRPRKNGNYFFFFKL